MKPLEERITDFKRDVWIALDKPNSEHPEVDMMKRFIAYWTEHNEPVKHNTKMRFEKEKTFMISLRWATWKRNEETNFGKKIKPKDQPKTAPGTVRMNWNVQTEDSGIDYEAYKKRMESESRNHRPGNIGSVLREQFGR